MQASEPRKTQNILFIKEIYDTCINQKCSPEVPIPL